MGIPLSLATMIAFEHVHKPICGDVLSLGRQTVIFDEQKLLSVYDRYGIQSKIDAFEYDSNTVQAKSDIGKRYIVDECFWRSFGVKNYDIVDVSDYEGATIVHDMCVPVDKSLYGRYDLIFNGSVLDNIFDPAAAMRNMSLMLKPNGRVIHIEMSSNLAFEYLIYSPDWFWDYYAINNFSDCRVYVCCFDSIDQMLNGEWMVYGFTPKSNGDSIPVPSLGSKYSVVVVVAEKGESSSHDRNPIQWCYRPKEANELMLAARKRFLSSPRPIFNARGDLTLRPEWEGFYPCGPTG